jgi:methylmalonyl-CoA mutase
MSADPAPPINLVDGFDPADFAIWQGLAQKALKGAPLERLYAELPGGIAVKGLYRPADRDLAPSPAIDLPARDPFMAWDIRQIITEPEPSTANAVALEHLEGGANSVEFVIDPTGVFGVRANSNEAIATLIRGIDTSLAVVALNSPIMTQMNAESLASAVHSDHRATARLAFNLDVSAAGLSGVPALDFKTLADDLRRWHSVFPMATILRADSRPVAEGGGTGVDELAVLIASGIENLRLGQAAGLDATTTNRILQFTCSVGADTVVEIARLRAARILWSHVLAASGASGTMRLQAVTQIRMMTRRDSWTNMIRTTCAAFAAGVGGADSVTVAPFTAASGLPDALARRMARNTCLILQTESHLGAVADPGAGSFAIETMTRDFATVAWGRVQEIEAAGGLIAALDAGLVQRWVTEARVSLQRDVMRRKVPVVGISEFANLAETPPGAGAGNAPAGDGIAPIRLAEPFEALRDAAEGFGEAKVFLATLGPLAKFNARAGFARNAFEAGGLAAIGADRAHADTAALVAAFTASGATIACLCGDDATYGEAAEVVAAALKAAGARAVWLAGKADIPGVDRTIFAGADILAALQAAHAILGIAP